MTIAPPPDTAALPDEKPRAVESGAHDAAVDDLLRKVKTEDGRKEILSVLNRRLGDGMSRHKKQDVLKGALPQGQPLFRNLLNALGVSETSEAADETIRVLTVAVDMGTSDALLRRAMEAVQVMVTDANDRDLATSPRKDQSSTEATSFSERPSPSIAAPRPQEKSPPKATPAPRKVEYDPNGPFRMPDRVVRFGEFGDMLAAPLIAPADVARGGGPVRIPSALPAPPDTVDGDLIRGWLRGIPSFTDSIAMRVGLLDTGDPGDLMEIESEFHNDPKGALRLYKAINPVADGTVDAAWCARLGRDIGRFSVTHEKAVETLAHALRESILRGPGERRDVLARSGTVLVVREELAEAVCGLIDAEADYLSDGPAETSGPPQNLMGSFSPNADLSEGRCLERALFLHVSASVPLGSAMRQSLTEFRLAQAMRENPAAPLATLDQRFERDAALPLEELSGRVPIVRIGYTEPALV